MALPQELLEASLRRSFATDRWLLEDVGDEDCFWEPATPCWPVRPREAASAGWGTGDWLCEDAWPPPDPLPITSIAWRIAHLAAWTDIYRNWTFEDQSLALRQLEVPGRRDELVAWLQLSQDRFSEAVGELEEAELVALHPAHSSRTSVAASSSLARAKPPDSLTPQTGSGSSPTAAPRTEDAPSRKHRPRSPTS